MTLLVTAPALAWLGLRTLRSAPMETIAAAAITGAAAILPALPFLTDQMSARPDQYAGFAGVTTGSGVDLPRPPATGCRGLFRGGWLRPPAYGP